VAGLDDTDRRLLETIQQAVPLTPRPFEQVARRLGLAEADVLARLRRVRDEGLVSRISAIFDTRGLGYESALVAATVPPERVDAAAAIINEHPGVSHNYLRTAAYNLWFTLAVPPDSRLGLERTAARLAELSGAMSYRLLPAVRVFKIGVRLPLAESDEELPIETAVQSASAPCEPAGGELELTPQIMAAVLALQENLPIEPRPFDATAARHGLTVERMLALAEQLRGSGVMRRYAAVLRHRAAGYAVNCMTVWSVPAERIEQIGAILAGFREVTHCYQRPAFPDWPYDLYAMVHCRAPDDCRRLIDRMKAATSIADVQEVYSTKEYKKARLEYFSPAFAEWETRHSV
jgi:DNA-binding Lrp family transcriptional regulator